MPFPCRGEGEGGASVRHRRGRVPPVTPAASMRWVAIPGRALRVRQRRAQGTMQRFAQRRRSRKSGG